MGKAFYRVGNSVKWGGFSSGTVGEKLFSHMGREGCYAMLGPFFQGGCLPRDRLFFGWGGGLFYNASNMFNQVLVLQKSPLGFLNLLN